MQDHGFYLSIAYSVSAILLALELFLLRQRCRRARKLAKDEQA